MIDSDIKTLSFSNLICQIEYIILKHSVITSETNSTGHLFCVLLCRFDDLPAKIFCFER